MGWAPHPIADEFTVSERFTRPIGVISRAAAEGERRRLGSQRGRGRAGLASVRLECLAMAALYHLLRVRRRPTRGVAAWVRPVVAGIERGYSSSFGRGARPRRV